MERNDHMPYTSHIIHIFKHFSVSFDGYDVQKVKDSKKIRASTLRSMKFFRTVGRGFVYEPYVHEGDVIVDSKDQKFMRNKCDMMFIRKKGIQPQPSFVEEEEEEVKGEDVDTEVNVEQEGVVEGEAGPSKVNKTKFDKLQQDF